MKVSDLTENLLDYWALKALGLDVEMDADGAVLFGLDSRYDDEGLPIHTLSPSRRWRSGGPMLAELMSSGHFGVMPASHGEIAVSTRDSEGLPYDETCEIEVHQTGPTLLIAAVRAYVASTYGDEVPDVTNFTG